MYKEIVCAFFVRIITGGKSMAKSKRVKVIIIVAVAVVIVAAVSIFVVPKVFFSNKSSAFTKKINTISL